MVPGRSPALQAINPQVSPGLSDLIGRALAREAKDRYADAASFAINSSTGAVTFVASPDYETKTSYSINVKASDASGANNVQQIWDPSAAFYANNLSDAVASVVETLARQGCTQAAQIGAMSDGAPYVTVDA